MLAGADSGPVTITVGAPTHVSITTQPSATATGGTDFATQPVVTVRDAGGNTVTGNTSNVTLALTTPAGAALGCTNNTVAAVAGVATFAGCDIDLASITPYTLDATDGVLVGDTSTGIAVSVGGAARMAFTTQPSATATGGTDFVAQPVVTVQDAGGNTVTTDTSSVTLSLSTPAGAVLGCTSNGPIATVSGVATFAGCDINLASATPYTLRRGQRCPDRSHQRSHHRLGRNRDADRIRHPAQRDRGWWRELRGPTRRRRAGHGR